LGFQEIGGALAEINQHRERPAGRIRLNVLSDGARLLIAQRLPAFLEDFPDVAVEVSVIDQMVDIVAAGFDAGIRFGGTVPEDYVAVRLSPPLRWVTVASPRYLNRSAPIAEPEDLRRHRCIQIRTGQGVIYRWDFECEGEHRVVEVPGQLCVNETTLGIEMSLAHGGVFYCLERRVSQYIARGELQVVLPNWAPMEPGFYVYYPGHRQVPPGLPELIEALKEY